MKTTPHTTIKRFLIVTSVALAIPLSASAVGGRHGGHGDCGFEAHGGPGHHMMEGNMMPRHLHGLNLTEAQQDKVFEIMHGQAPVMRDKAKALRKAEGDLHALTAAPDYSEAKARTLADTAAKAMAEMALLRAKTDRKVFEVLSPDQRKQLAEMKPAGESPRHRGDGPRSMGGEDRVPPTR
ncbi:MAG TPA: Spy/CpxP family protein refolding chaperone [Azonexus sp.]|nr:Spy/CpxP family protein refolding chaperone [Azonexus sp.]